MTYKRKKLEEICARRENEMNKKVITVKPATFISQQSKLPSVKKRKVAGYARVSTDQDEQQNSYETQIAYYTQYIAGREDWEFVKMYSDEGISGTNTKHRLGFKEMIEDALDGKIDLILTKSVSRFARNTVDSLSTVRQLKDAGVEIYFEKENIWTFDSKGELLITIMSSLAQEESRSISENVTWSKRKLAAEGKVTFSYQTVLGFKAKADGGFEVDQEQAKIVRYIFGQALLGVSPSSIAKTLTKQGIPTPAGKTKWSYTTIKSILQNEKYKGDALLQKSFTTDFLTKQRKNNEGELPQYYVENNHQAIIDKETFDSVQQLLQTSTKWGTSKNYYGKLICGCCGHSYGRHVWHSSSKYRQIIYRCNHKYKSEEKCTTPHITDEQIHDWSVKAINHVLQNKDEIIDNLTVLLNQLMNQSELEFEIETLTKQLENIHQQVVDLVGQNAKVTQSQKDYHETYQKLVEQYEQCEKQQQQKISSRLLKNNRVKELKGFINELKQQEELLTTFDEQLFNTFVEKIEIHQDKSVTITLKNGKAISM